MIKREDASFLFQLVESMQVAQEKMEQSYFEKDFSKFKQLKKFLESANSKIEEMLK